MIKLRKEKKECRKCANAAYCRYSKDKKHCHANQAVIDNCLYLRNLDEYISVLLELNEKEIYMLEKTV